MCDWEQFQEKEQRAEDWYDLVDGVLMSRAGMARDDDHTRLVGELCVLISRLWTGGMCKETLYRA